MDSARKSTSKSTAQRPRKIPQPHGGALHSGGTPGNKGGGRPPDEFKRRMKEIASSDEALEYLDQCVRGLHGPKAAAAARSYATDRGYGKVPNETTIRGDPTEPLTVRIVRE